MRKVRAKERGFDNVKLREKGEEFLQPDGDLYAWVELVDEEPTDADAQSEDESAGRDEAESKDQSPPPRKRRSKV